MTIPALKPCPFCGSAATLEDERLLWVARCTGCGACVLGDRAPDPEQEMPSAYWESFKQSAVDRWNRQAASPTPDPETLAEALAARRLLQEVARLDNSVGITVAEVRQLAEQAAAWLRENPQGQPVASDPALAAPKMRKVMTIFTVGSSCGAGACLTQQECHCAAALLQQQQARIAGLRSALADCGRAVGASISDDCSDGFLEVPAEVRLAVVKTTPAVVPVAVSERLPDPRPESEGGDCGHGLPGAAIRGGASWFTPEEMEEIEAMEAHHAILLPQSEEVQS